MSPLQEKPLPKLTLSWSPKPSDHKAQATENPGLNSSCASGAGWVNRLHHMQRVVHGKAVQPYTSMETLLAIIFTLESRFFPQCQFKTEC